VLEEMRPEGKGKEGGLKSEGEKRGSEDYDGIVGLKGVHGKGERLRW
jgi:hypothetical protein